MFTRPLALRKSCKTISDSEPMEKHWLTRMGRRPQAGQH
jgi:hypothetical protein